MAEIIVSAFQHVSTFRPSLASISGSAVGDES
jgi:hypothetical protein